MLFIFNAPPSVRHAVWRDWWAGRYKWTIQPSIVIVFEHELPPRMAALTFFNMMADLREELAEPLIDNVVLVPRVPLRGPINAV